MRFPRSAPHCVRRFSRNDRVLLCHPERSASGVEGSHLLPVCPEKKFFDRMNRIKQDSFKDKDFLTMKKLKIWFKNKMQELKATNS